MLAIAPRAFAPEHAASASAEAAAPVDRSRYVVVDAAKQTLRMIENGREVDAMRVVVGKPGMETPELAGRIRFVVVNPYWNIPPDLVRDSIAPQVLREGTAVLDRRRLVLSSDWRATDRLRPQDVDWAAVAAGRKRVWVRQLPGEDNMLGRVKFTFPNRLGIYLHDTPNKAAFLRGDRRLSSGCVRVEDAPRLARWLFRGREVIDGVTGRDTRIDLPQSVPVYIRYSAGIAGSGRPQAA